MQGVQGVVKSKTKKTVKRSKERNEMNGPKKKKNEGTYIVKALNKYVVLSLFVATKLLRPKAFCLLSHTTVSHGLRKPLPLHPGVRPPLLASAGRMGGEEH